STSATTSSRPPCASTRGSLCAKDSTSATWPPPTCPPSTSSSPTSPSSPCACSSTRCCRLRPVPVNSCSQSKPNSNSPAPPCPITASSPPWPSAAGHWSR